MSVRTGWGKWAVFGVLSMLGLTFLAPLLWMISTSLKPIEETMDSPPKWIPSTVRWENYKKAVVYQWTHDVMVDGLPVASVVDASSGRAPLGPVLRKLGWEVEREGDYLTLARNGREARLSIGEEPTDAQFDTTTDDYLVDCEVMGSTLGAEVALKPEDPVPPFARYALNTLYLVVLGVTGTVLANALIAYGFARLRWRGRDTLFALTLATMMIPFPVIMVPIFAVFRNLGWVGSFKPLWVPAWFGSAFNIFLLRQFFRTIPEELSDAARIDGCSEFGIFRNIILPLSKPALAVVALFHFMYTWNDFLGPLIYLTEKKMFTLSLGLQFYQSQHGGTEWNMLMAASTIIVMPMIIIFFLAQRTFIQGIALTGLKG